MLSAMPSTNASKTTASTQNSPSTSSPTKTTLEADSCALGPVLRYSSLTVAAPSKRVRKKKELVRVSELILHEQFHFHLVVRRTRMIYDSIRVLCTIEKEKRVQEEKRAVEKRAAAAEEERIYWRHVPLSDGIGCPWIARLDPDWH
ncbi:hypothetical protein AHAS_Ahas08G0169100 [Arachis hypogaea]